MTPEELATANATGKAPCGCVRTVSEDTLSWSTAHDENCALLKPTASSRARSSATPETTTGTATSRRPNGS